MKIIWSSRQVGLTKRVFDVNLFFSRADRILADWTTTYQASLKIYDSLPPATKPAFFQLVHHPVQASYQLQNMYTAGQCLVS